MVSRMLGAVPVLADSIVEQLCKASDRASDSHQQLGSQTEEETAALSAAVWHSIWPVERCGPPCARPCTGEGFVSAPALTACPGCVLDSTAKLLRISPICLSRLLQYLLRTFTVETATSSCLRVWYLPVCRIRQRAFFSFGMDVLLKLDLSETRQFFAAFFALSDFHWQGFLSARLSFIELIGFGLSLFAKSSNEARLNLLVKGLPGLAGMLFGLLRTIGYEDRMLGKEERHE